MTKKVFKRIKQWVCRSCGYEWFPRVETPKQCPKCHVYLDKQDIPSRVSEIETNGGKKKSA